MSWGLFLVSVFSLIPLAVEVIGCVVCFTRLNLTWGGEVSNFEAHGEFLFL